MVLIICPILLLVAFGASSCNRAEPGAPLSDEELDKLARTFIRYMVEAQSDDAVAMMDSRMAGAMPAAKVTETWQSIETQAGAFSSVTDSRVAAESGYKCVYVGCKFGNMDLEAKVVFDASGKVNGLWFLPSKTASVPYTTPSYADESLFTEFETTIGNDKWMLPGTVTMPKGEGPFPAVALVHGSGPNDRDETIGGNKPFKDLAWGLASRGIAVLRYEKRTAHYPQEAAAEIATFTVKEETIDDAVAAVDMLRSIEGVDPERVYVLGHSLGAYLGPRIVAQAREDDPARIAGLIMLAPPARSLLDLMVEQAEYVAALDGSTSDAEKAEIQSIRDEAAKIIEGLQEGEIDLGASKAYWDDLQAYDAVATARTLDVPMLILQGERDYQVTMEDYLLWTGGLVGKDGLTMRSFPYLNHLFVYGEEKSAPEEYQEAGNVDAAVIEEIGEWIRAN